MDDSEIRRTFADFCGTERYRQFISAIWSKGIPKQRLIFWQEQLWREYAKGADGLPSSFSEFYRVFRICPKHLELLEVVEQYPDDQLGIAQRSVPEDDRVRLFPFAIVAVTQGFTEWLSCPTCRADLSSHNAAVRSGT